MNSTIQELKDQELLELAAKAAGYKLSPLTRRVGHRDEPTVLKGVGLVTQDGRDWVNGVNFWNPLTDDGDALRLANAKHMVIDFKSGTVIVEIESNWRTFDYTAGDLASLKLAILRAAAEISKEM